MDRAVLPAVATRSKFGSNEPENTRERGTYIWIEHVTGHGKGSVGNQTRTHSSVRRGHLTEITDQRRTLPMPLTEQHRSKRERFHSITDPLITLSFTCTAHS